ncbi:cytosolic Fe-S cluster assembly factor Nar1 [Pelomyxa schiedti]|nr:cytosolic Fe-S cluster assembly factor Nar1 [Pelomyxa schiedti]
MATRTTASAATTTPTSASSTSGNSGGFSIGLRLSDLNDFIAPSQACVKPVNVPKDPSQKRAKIELADDGTYVEVADDGTQKALMTAKITLNDCLACSGCITSAESVLVTAQSIDEFLKQLQSGKTTVVSISPQSRASIAAYFHLTAIQTFKKLTHFFKTLGVSYVFDTSFGREFSLLETASDFIARHSSADPAHPLPMLASSCPGWICYAEKTHPECLPNISTAKSPQAVMGTLIKYHFAPSLHVMPADIYHVTIMPCYDKKLEASRDDFYNPTTKAHDVDTVLSTIEVIDLLTTKAVDFANLPEATLDTLYSNAENDILFGQKSGSGGYLEYLVYRAATDIFHVDPPKTLEFRPVCNTDFRETILKDREGNVLMRFAKAYGFRNITNVTRRLKARTLEYAFVEIMACPFGCLCGGGQIRPAPPQTPESLRSEVEVIYDNQQEVRLPDDNTTVRGIYESWVQTRSKALLHTQYHTRANTTRTNPMNIQW